MKLPKPDGHALAGAMSGSPLRSHGSTDTQLPAETLSDEPNPPGEKKSWGFHLLIDMSNCNEAIDSPDAIERFFAALIEELDMKPLSPIMIKKVEGEEGRGVSAVQMITTSSITFHSDDDKRSVYLDIFSCKDFDPQQALKFVKQTFEPSHMASELIYRDAGLSENAKRN